MITIPLSGFAIAYFVLLALLLIFYVAVIYQLIATGTFTAVSIFVTLFVSAAMIGVLVVTAGYASGVDWGEIVTIFGSSAGGAIL